MNGLYVNEKFDESMKNDTSQLKGIPIGQSELQKRINRLAELSVMSEVLSENISRIVDSVFGGSQKGCGEAGVDQIVGGGLLFAIDEMIDNIQINLDNAMRGTARLQEL